MEMDRKANFKKVSLFINNQDGDHIGVEKLIKTNSGITTE